MNEAKIIADRLRAYANPDTANYFGGAANERWNLYGLLPEAADLIESLAKDAARYQWMKREVKRIPPGWGLIGWDAAIDAAMQAEQA